MVDAEPVAGSIQWKVLPTAGSTIHPFRDFRLDPRGVGLHAIPIPPGEVVRLTQTEVLSHPLYNGFGALADSHPPMRGWLATRVCGDGGAVYGFLQLSDKPSGGDFDEADEMNIRDLAALVGVTLDALRLAVTGATLDQPAPEAQSL